MLCDAMLVIIPSGGDVGAARHARRWRPSQAQQELMQARQDRPTFENSIMCAYRIQRLSTGIVVLFFSTCFI